MIASRGFRRSPVAPLFGREEILEEAHRALDRAKGGAGAGLLLMGPGGVGKTQLLHAIVERAGRRGFTVLTGRALPEELPPAFSLVRELLASERAAGSSSASTPWTPPGTRRGGPMAGEGGEAAGGLQARSPSATASADLEALIPARLSRPEPAESRREELFAQIEKDLLDRSENSPLLIAVDDMHFADNSSLDFFCRFAGKLAGSHITLVATVAELPDLPERTRSAIETLSGVSGVLSMPIRPLNFLETEEFVRWILGGRSPDRNDVRRWHAQTDGNPLFIEQLVRTATGLTGPPKGSEGDAQAVTEILFERVKGQADRERRVLTYAAVLGKEFQFASLSAVLAMGEEAVTESLDRLVHDGLIREKGGEVYEFVSEAVRRDLYASLTETRRRILHARAGSALEGKPGTSDSELARHFYLGREEAKAVEYNVKAARGAARDLDFLTATLLIGRALEAERRRPEPEPRVEIRLLTEQGRLLEEIGVLPPSDELLTEAVTIGRKAVDAELELGRALLGLAQTRTTRSEYESAESLATEALERLEKVGTPRDLMAGHRVLGTVAWRRGEFEAAGQHHRAAVEIARKEGTPLELGHALVDLGNTLFPVGATQIEPALEVYRQAAELFESVGEYGARARVLMNKSVAEYHTGRPDEALRDLEKAIEAADRSRSPIWIGYCNLNLSQWQAELGHPDLARAPLARAHEALGPLGDRLGDQQLAMSEGMIAEAEHDFTSAEAHYRDSLAKARDLRIAAEISEMLYRLANLAVARGEKEEARRWLVEARESGVANFRPDFAARLDQLEKSIDAAA